MDDLTTEVVDCNAVILDSTTLLASPSAPQKLNVKNKGVIGKVPVTIAQTKVQIYVEAVVRLPDPALAITNVNKSVFLTRCLLLPTDDKKSSKLLLHGIVRKTLQLAIPNEDGTGRISGDIRFASFDIPFKCFAKVDFLVEPDIDFNESTKLLQNVDENLSGPDLSQDTFLNSQVLNERVFCQLVETKVREVDAKYDLSAFDNRTLFSTINESMVVELTLRVLQNQLVEVSGGSEGGGGGKGGSGSSGGKGSSDGKGDREDREGKGDREDREGKGDREDREGKGDREDKEGKGDKDDKEAKEDKHEEADKEDDKGRKSSDVNYDTHQQRPPYYSSSEQEKEQYRDWEKRNYGR